MSPSASRPTGDDGAASSSQPPASSAIPVRTLGRRSTRSGYRESSIPPPPPALRAGGSGNPGVIGSSTGVIGSSASVIGSSTGVPRARGQHPGGPPLPASEPAATQIRVTLRADDPLPPPGFGRSSSSVRATGQVSLTAAGLGAAAAEMAQLEARFSSDLPPVDKEAAIVFGKIVGVLTKQVCLLGCV